MFACSPLEARTYARLSTPQKVQDFLDALPINHEKDGETCLSPRQVLKEQKAHCLEGALLAAAAFIYHGRPPLLVNFRTMNGDEDHTVTLFSRDGRWGAVSKTNHPVLRYRDPVYESVRELVMSYFHEYFMFTDGRKTLRAFSKPVNARRFGTRWITADEDLWDIAYALQDAPHVPLFPKTHVRALRPATPFERKATDVIEWRKRDPRT